MQSCFTKDCDLRLSTAYEAASMAMLAEAHTLVGDLVNSANTLPSSRVIVDR